MCHYTHFTIKERECLLLMKKDNIPNEKIAKILGRSFSSVSKELNAGLLKFVPEYPSSLKC